MALADRVTARIPATRLAQLTNPSERGSGQTTDTTTLGYAVDDVLADLRILAGLTYDDTDSRHVSVGVDGVVLKLQERTGALYGPALETARAAWEKRVSALARVTSRNRITPTTNSPYTPTDPNPNGQTIRPPLDRSHFDRLLINPVSTSEDEE